MNSFLAVVCLILGVVTQGDAILCTQCSSAVPLCSGSTKTCPSQFVCMSFYQASSQGSLGSPESVFFFRDCAERQHCGKSGVFAIPSGKHRFSSNCCESDNCTPSVPMLPSVDHTYNGKSCPYCMSESSLDCNSNETMQCMGDENNCALQNTEVTGGSDTYKSSTRGCATKGYCDLGTQILELGGVKMETVVKCGASTALYSALTLLILATASLISNVF